ncbi:biotin--[acetyl-CoA-carboxylase] ligase [Clostridium hydrogenum]|uniref:biotin--[acetyl-CoA-carboxylase] ligase n=1 Tax=Clostridium hydrogenum TaxID=2855764 RepID=UPI002E330506|nr:biotin--[acetyl-CoA-carboxylase] ligase [Clostridium hydrogenum]
MKGKILDILKSNSDDFVSGQSISRNLGVTRAAVWKYINKLKEEGYLIESVSKKGYRLKSCPDLLTYDEIKDILNTRYIGRHIVYYDSIGSTNDEAKKLAIEDSCVDGTVVIAEEQTSGRGRFDRKWASAKYKCINMSIILKPNIEAYNVALISSIAAAAVGMAIDECGMKAKVKWPNDIVVNWRKVCGILAEASGEMNRLNYVIVGIGINVNQESKDFSEEILDKATSIKIEKDKCVSRKMLLCSLLDKFEKLYDEFLKSENAERSLKYCKENSILIGRKIEVIRKNQITVAKAVDIDEMGALVVENENGVRERLISGEVSLHRVYHAN